MSQEIQWYKQLYLIRQAENKIAEYYFDDEMKTPMHMSKGGEAIAVGVLSAMQPDDHVTCTYRTHAVYLTKTAGDTDTFFKELYGKEGGTADGKAGSMHLLSPKNGFLCSTAIVGTNIPVGLGIAYANKVAGNGKMTAIFFGDGAVDEGAFWESINIACLMKLPVIFVYEDNGYAVHSPAKDRHSYFNLIDIVKNFTGNVDSDMSNEVDGIYEITKKAISTYNDTKMPAFIRLKYYRYLEHVGVCEDFKAGYRPKSEYDHWSERDPISMQRENILKSNMLPEDKICAIEMKINEQIENSIQAAKEAKFANLLSLCEGVIA
tara:strand:+ start:5016 stop:5975 length:960 start_codon:yes stop_codon:yes gene_type:complete